MVEDDDLMSFIRMQQFEINFLANEITKDNVKPRFKYHDIIKHINNFIRDLAKSILKQKKVLLI